MKAEKTSRAASIRRLLADGKTPLQIAATLGCLPAAVHSVIFYDRKKAEKLKAKAAPKRGPGRPKGSKSKGTVIASAAPTDLRLQMDQIMDSNQTLRQRLDEEKSRLQHAEKVLNSHIEELKGTVRYYQTMDFFQRLGFLFRGA